MRVYIFLFSVFISGFFFSCDSTAKKKVELEESHFHQDSLALLYNPQERDPKVHEFMQRLHKRSGFNGNVLVSKKGKIIYQNSFGWANYLMRDSLNLNSQFELASVSKPITALAVLKLMEEGKLRLDQKIEEFFPKFPNKGITIEHLLTHQSGLGNYIYFTESEWKDKRKGMSNQDVLDIFYRIQPAPYGKPGGRFFYNNTNYMMLASIVEKVSGMTFPQYMEENVLKPLGMRNTNLYSTVEYDKIPTDVIGHDKIWRRSVVQNFQDGTYGDKGIYSTIHDLYLLDRNLRNGRLLSQETLDSAYVGRSKKNKNLFSYGYGWRTFESENDHVVYHTGWWHGFKSLYIRDLKNDVVIVLITNLANNSLLNLDSLYRILDMPIIRQEAYNGRGELVVK